jgi:perosamine synthetase
VADIDIPVTRVRFSAEVEDLVLQVVRSGNVAQGPMVARLEQLFATVTGAQHAVAVNNGTTALVLALEALGIGPGDEVITTPFTFVATINAIIERGATVRFADIDPATFNIDPAAIADACSTATSCLLPVHLYGQAAEMREVVALAEKRQLALVEDAAQAVGATYSGQGVGSFGVGTFSLYATKNVTSAEGGIVTTNDELVADRMRILRNQGMRQRYVYEVPGHNYRLTDLAAALAIPQMEVLADTNARRVENARILSEGLSDLTGRIEVPVTAHGNGHVWHQYTIRVSDDSPVTRDQLAEELARRGIGTGAYYPKVCYDYDCYRDHPLIVQTRCVEAERAARQVLSLPVHPYLSAAELGIVIDSVRLAVGASATS